MALQEGSLAHQIGALKVGETFSRTVMLGLSKSGFEDRLRETKRSLRNNLNKQADRAGKETGNAYRLDCGTWHASEDAAVFVTVAITRMM